MTTAPAPQDTAGARHAQPLTRTQKILTGIVAGAVLIIATLGFIGSYAAVTKLATIKGFGDFADAFPIAIDAGIIAFLALDLLLTWRRIAFPLLRYTAWGLTAATIAFNAAAAWPDPIGSAMHGVIPILFVIAVEAARHAIGRIADITADKYMEGPNASRWLLNPIGTFILWRRQRLWSIRTWDEVLKLERERRIYTGTLRKEHGRSWRRKAGADQLLILRLARDGMSITAATELPEAEARKRTEAEAKRTAEAKQTELDQRVAEAEAEAKARTELALAAEAEAEAKLRTETAAAEAEAAARILKAETEAKLAAIARRTATEAAEAAAQEQEARRRAEAAAEAKRIAASVRASVSDPKQESETASDPKSSAANLGGQRTKREAEIEAVLIRITEARDPKSVSLEDVKRDFDLKHGAAWDRLSTARDLWAQAQPKTA